MKFNPAEMDYDPSPEETEKWMPIPGRGWTAYRRFLAWKRQMARLDPDIRKAFPDDRSVNWTLRKVIELQDVRQRAKLKKTA